MFQGEMVCSFVEGSNAVQGYLYLVVSIPGIKYRMKDTDICDHATDYQLLWGKCI
ncbi:hypothetical protein ES703_61209 [subsurface metagenome]